MDRCKYCGKKVRTSAVKSIVRYRAGRFDVRDYYCSDTCYHEHEYERWLNGLASTYDAAMKDSSDAFWGKTPIHDVKEIDVEPKKKETK